MAPRSKWIPVLAALGVLIAMHCTVAPVHAGSAVVVTGGYKPGTDDPPYDYIFNVTLDPPPVPPGGTNFIAYNDYFTITGLPGVTSGSLSSQPNANWSADPGTDTMEWIYKGNTNITADSSTGAVYIGQFVVETTQSFSSPPVTSGETIDYHFGYNAGTASGSGSFQIFAVPEPSSIIMLLTGAAALPVFLMRQRIGRRRRSVQTA